MTTIIANIEITDEMLDDLEKKSLDILFKRIMNKDDFEFCRNNDADEIPSYLYDRVDDAMLDAIKENYPKIWNILEQKANDNDLNNLDLVNKLLVPLSDKIFNDIMKEFE